MSSAGGSFGDTGLHVGSDWRVWCSQYPDESPILTVGAGSTSVTISIAGRTGTGPDAVKFARELAAETARFAAECERLAAHAASDDAARTKAA